MAERRSLVAGVEAAPDGVDPHLMRAFINQDAPDAGQRVSQPADDPVPLGEEKTPVERPNPAGLPRPSKTVPFKRPKASSLHSALLVPVTVRLKPEIADALKRASLQRQLNGIETYTQQDIVEDALTPWLKSEGLLE
jgi:hypothetical protein